MNQILLTPEQVAQRLQVTERTVYTWLRSGRMRGVKLGRLWRVTEEDVAAFLGGIASPALAPPSKSVPPLTSPATKGQEAAESPVPPKSPAKPVQPQGHKKKKKKR